MRELLGGLNAERKGEIKTDSMYRLILFLLVVAINGHAQQISFEQIAINYFATNILNDKYPDGKRVYFSGQSEGEQTIIGPFAKCFGSDSNFSKFFYEQKKGVSESVPIEIGSFPRLKKSTKVKSNCLSLKVHRSVVNSDLVYVYINVFKEKHFVDHYLIKMSSSSNTVVDVCRESEII